MREYTEPLSPFVHWTPAERTPITERQVAEAERPGLFVHLLRNPRAVVHLLLDRQRVQRTVFFSIVSILLSSAFSGFVMSLAWADGMRDVWITTLLLPAGILSAIASAMGPIYAAGILYAVRLPLARVACVLLAAVAAGSIFLAALSPLALFMWSQDRIWIGPLTVVGVFVLVAGTSGGVIRRLLLELAATMNPELAKDKDTVRRLRAFSRVAFLLLSLPIAAGAWGYLA